MEKWDSQGNGKISIQELSECAAQSPFPTTTLISLLSMFSFPSRLFPFPCRSYSLKRILFSNFSSLQYFRTHTHTHTHTHTKSLSLFRRLFKAVGPDQYTYFFQMANGGLPATVAGCPWGPGLSDGNAVSTMVCT